MEARLSEHKKLLRAIFQNLDEDARISFLNEVLDSLSLNARKALLEGVTTADDPVSVDAFKEVSTPFEPKLEILSESLVSTQADETATATPALIEALAAKSKDEPGDNEEKIQAALAAFEKHQSIQAATQKKSMRKEAASCLGLILLGAGILIGASIGLKYLWQVLFP